MDKGKRLIRIILYFIPFVMQIIIHAAGTFVAGRDRGNVLWHLCASVIVSVVPILLGEGYAAIAFIVAGFYDRIAAYIVVIILSVISAGASFVGYIITGIEGYPCLWMTILFWCIDLFLFVFGIIRIAQLVSLQNRIYKGTSSMRH